MSDEHSDLLAELALGILTGRERAATLAHVDSCPRCAEELELLSRAADAVVQVAPDLEPPVGFEVRLFERMGVSEPKRNRVIQTRWLLAAAAVVALGLGLGIGLSGSTTPKSPTTGLGRSHEGALVSSAVLRQQGQQVGRVYTYGGSQPWMFMMLADSSVSGHVTCEVITTDGVIHKVGTFTAKKGYGAWGAALPVAPQDVHTAEVVSTDGAVLATATLH
jgi:hypothetical protein